MDAFELKNYIIQNEKIKYILENLECHNIKQYSTEFRCGLPGHSNKTSISVKIESLSIGIYQSEDETVRGDIFTLCMHLKSISFPKSVKYIHEILGLEYSYTKKEEKKEKRDPLEVFKKIKRKNHFTSNFEIYDENSLIDYLPYPHIEWLRDGISAKTCERFKIGYSNKHKRIVIPVRYWCGSENDFIGVIGRTTVKTYEEFDIPKYFPLIKYSKSLNLYGLQENYNGIQTKNQVVVYESEKSVLKRFTRLDETGVAVGSHSLSEEQIRILIGLNVDITIAYDKDIPLQHIRSECEKFYGIRNINYIFDKRGLLKEKESPADAHNRIFEYLLKNKIKYDEKEHELYIKSLKKELKLWT